MDTIACLLVHLVVLLRRWILAVRANQRIRRLVTSDLLYRKRRELSRLLSRYLWTCSDADLFRELRIRHVCGTNTTMSKCKLCIIIIIIEIRYRHRYATNKNRPFPTETCVHCKINAKVEEPWIFFFYKFCIKSTRRPPVKHFTQDHERHRLHHAGERHDSIE